MKENVSLLMSGLALLLVASLFGGLLISAYQYSSYLLILSMGRSISVFFILLFGIALAYFGLRLSSRRRGGEEDGYAPSADRWAD